MTSQPDDLETRRSAAFETLQEHYAHERLLDEDFETRLEQLQDATSVESVDRALEGLPEFDAEGRRVIRPYGEQALALRDEQGLMAEDAAADALLPAGADAPFAVSAAFGQTRRSGSWQAPRHVEANASFGEVVLDFRQAELLPGLTEVSANANFGSVRIIVPPDLPVECVGSATMGDFSGYSHSSSGRPESDPHLRIGGQAFFGSVEVRARPRLA